MKAEVVSGGSGAGTSTSAGPAGPGGPRAGSFVPAIVVAAVLVLAIGGAIVFSQRSKASDPDPAVMKRMQYYNEALGVGCEYCHVPGKFTIETPRLKTARWMQQTIVDGMVTRDGNRTVDCKSCHLGRAKFLPSSEGY